MSIMNSKNTIRNLNALWHRKIKLEDRKFQLETTRALIGQVFRRLDWSHRHIPEIELAIDYIGKAALKINDAEDANDDALIDVEDAIRRVSNMLTIIDEYIKLKQDNKQAGSITPQTEKENKQ